MRHREGERPISGYKLEAFLGEGGYGEVWRATGPGGVPCALKFIKLDSKAGMKELKSIGLVKKLRHPNLVPLNAVWLRDEDGNTMSSEGGEGTQSLSFRVYGDKELVIAMGLGSGSLADKLAGARAEKAADALPGGLSLRKLLGYMQDAARGIDCLNDPPAHDNPGVLPLVHCDIKPANLLLVGGCVQVCDYGVAKAVGNDIKKTMAAGTAAYAPPELINNDPGLKSDQYSLAISYYELRTGHLPLDETKAMMAHLMGMLDFARVPAEEREVLQQATAMKVADRFPTCDEFVEALYVASGRTIAGPSGARHFPVNRPPSQADTSGDIELSPAPPPRPTSDILRPAGSPVAGYTLEKMLGQGGYGQVWQAKDEDGVACALKVLRDIQGKGRHEYETLVHLRKLDHPNLLHIERLWVLDEFWAPIPSEQLGLPNGREARRLVIRTPLADKNLFQRLSECRRHSQPGIPPLELLKYLRQAADALDYLNIDQQTQHRDVKPENLLLKGETLWVSDFGLAKVVPTGGMAAQSTSSGMTQEYASPEVLTNKQVTDRSDQYSLAVTYHVLRTGRLPFPPGLSMLDLIRARATGSLDLQELTEGEKPVLRRALSAYPGDRFTTCRELMAELAVALNMTTTGPMPVLSPPPAPPPPPTPPPTPPRKAVPVHGTIEFPTTETRVTFEADPLEPEPTTDWASPKSTRAIRPAAGIGPALFVDDKPSGGGTKLLFGGLAAAAVLGLGVAGFFLFSGDTPSQPTTPDVAKVSDAEVKTPPTPERKPEVNGLTVSTKPASSDEERLTPLRNPRTQKDPAAAVAALLNDPSPAVKRWAAEWQRVLAQPPAPAAVSLAELAAVHDQFAPGRTPAVPHKAELEAARKDVLTAYAATAARGFDFDDRDRWGQAKTILTAADPANEWVAAGVAEADLELNKTPATATAPPGFADYLRGVSEPGSGDRLAGAVPADKPDWFNPRRAGKLADLLAKAVAARGPKDDTVQVAKWLLAADRAAELAGPAGTAVRDRLAVDTVLLSVRRPELKELATKAAGRVTAETVKHLPKAAQAEVMAAVGKLGVANPAARLAAVQALRAQLAEGQSSPEAVAKLLPGLNDVDGLTGRDPDAATKSEAAGLLADAGRTLFRNRDRWAGKGGLGTPDELSQQATKLFEQAAGLSRNPDDVAWQGIVLFLRKSQPNDVSARVAKGAGDGPAGQVLKGLLGGAAPNPDMEGVQAAWESAVYSGKNADRYRDELAVAYRRGGDHAILYAHKEPTRAKRLLDTAVEWGAKLTTLEADQADGPILEGCAREDLAWLTRWPDGLAERCQTGGPYQTADACYRVAEERPQGDRRYATIGRGRNLVKWAEDQSQLGKYRGRPTDKTAPDDKRLKAAEELLKAVGAGAEPEYWLAEVAALRYDAATVVSKAGDPAALAKRAVAAFQRVADLPGDELADWRRDAAARRDEVYRAEIGRLTKAGRPAEAAALAEAAKLPAADRAKLHAEAGRWLMETGAQAANWPKAIVELEAAVRLHPASADRWQWRFDLGRAEHWRAGQASGSDALTAHALAVNHLRAFLFDGFGQNDPALKARYEALKKDQMGKMMKAAGEHFAVHLDVDPKKPPVGARAVWLLAQLDRQVDLDNGYEIVGVAAADKRRAQDLLATAEREKGTFDPKLLAAARELAARIKLFPDTKN